MIKTLALATASDASERPLADEWEEALELRSALSETDTGSGAPFPRGIVADHVMCGGRVVGVRKTICLRAPFYSLLHFVGKLRDAGPQVLIVAPLSGMRPPLLYDMLIDLLREGCDLHLLIWTDPIEIPAKEGPFGLDDNIGAVMDAMRMLGAGVHLIGLCQSALTALAAASLLATGSDTALPASLTLVGGKIDTRVNPTRLDRLARSLSLNWFEHNAIATVPPLHPGHGRRVYPERLQWTTLLAYVARHFLGGGELFAKMLHDDGEDAAGHPFLELLLSVQAVPGEFFLDTISSVFHGSALPQGRLLWRGVPVDPARITDTALLTIEAELDDISGPGQTYIAHDLCRGIPADRRAHHVQSGIGHFGLFHGAVWRKAILPRLCAFIGLMGTVRQR